MEEEYELVPMSPIRRLEKRMDKVEKTGSAGETTKELIEIVRANQHVIDEMVRINSMMIERISELLSSVNSMTQRMEDFLGRIEIASGGPEGSDDLEKKVDERLAKLEKRLNSLLLASISKSKLRPRPTTSL